MLEASTWSKKLGRELPLGSDFEFSLNLGGAYSSLCGESSEGFVQQDENK